MSCFDFELKFNHIRQDLADHSKDPFFNMNISNMSGFSNEKYVNLTHKLN